MLEKWLFKWSEQWQAFWEKRTDCVEQTGPWAQRCPRSLCQTPRQGAAIVSAWLYPSKHIVFVVAKKNYNFKDWTVRAVVRRTTWWFGNVWLFILALEGEILSTSAYSLWLIIFANPSLHFKDPLATICAAKANTGMTLYRKIEGSNKSATKPGICVKSLIQCIHLF